MACEKTSKKSLKCGLWIVLPILAISIVVLVLFSTIYQEVLKEEITLEKGTLSTKIWQDIPLPIVEKLYFFNITNVDAFLNGSETLDVTEVGPYAYKSRWVKNNLQWNSDSTVSYREIRTYNFAPDLSNGTEDDQIYTLNGPMILASAFAENFDIKIRIMLSALLGIAGEHIIIKRSVKQLAYGGYDDLIIKFAPIIKPDIPFKDGRFCWFYGKNNTDDGLFQVFTGRDDPSKTNFIYKWNGEKKLHFWKADTCNQMNGTSIECGPPIHNYQDSYAFFQSLLCRSVTFNYAEDVTYFGILGKRFKPTYSLFANSTENPDNYCFEMKKERASGVFDVSPCQFGAPVYFSFPHFYMADPSYLNVVNGLSPSGKDHESFLDVEPVSGFSIGAALRIQINVEISTIKGILQTYNITNGLFPVLWVELKLEIDEHFANYFKAMTRNPKIIAYSLLGILAGVSFILAIIFIVILCRRKSDNDEDDPLIDAVDKENHNSPNVEANSKKADFDSNWKEKLPKVDEEDDTDEDSTNYLHTTDAETSRLLK